VMGAIAKEHALFQPEGKLVIIIGMKVRLASTPKGMKKRVGRLGGKEFFNGFTSGMWKWELMTFSHRTSITNMRLRGFIGHKR
jgi:hypothetical protein